MTVVSSKTRAPPIRNRPPAPNDDAFARALHRAGVAIPLQQAKPETF